jgi:lipoprotein-anchoring transpeptidase ErfK/SrfK
MTGPFSNLHPVVADLIRRGMADARTGRTVFARREFEQALTLDPECGEALLWLAALAPDGETSLRYLSRALELNPRDPRAHAGIRWARKRVKPQPRGDESPQPTPRLKVEAGTSRGPSIIARLAELILPPASAETDDRPRRSLPKWQWALAAMSAACAALGGGLLLLDAAQAGQAGAAAPPLVAQASLTPAPALPPSSTATFTPTDTPSPTATPTLTDTPPPTPTETPTETPVPTATPLPPTATPIPLPTSTPYVPPAPPPAGDPSSRWIDINLSTQTVTAYEGDTPVRTFVVSTGLPGTPTVTGQFSIYLRYDSQTMSGPGYYLPGVQWVQYFYQGYALHGTYWHNNFGRPMSHGCVNMTNDDALWMYQWADYGTLVNVHY